MKKAQLFILAMLMTPMAAFSQGIDSHLNVDQTQVAENGEFAKTSMSDGEIRKINLETGKVTIKHGPLQNLDMPGMTMIFRLQDPAMLDQIKEGDKIKFIADKVDGAFVVKSLQVEK
jgi:Cu(I)/Ag(I) efflux system periplasmic protein CusF